MLSSAMKQALMFQVVYLKPCCRLGGKKKIPPLVPTIKGKKRLIKTLKYAKVTVES